MVSIDKRGNPFDPLFEPANLLIVVFIRFVSSHNGSQASQHGMTFHVLESYQSFFDVSQLVIYLSDDIVYSMSLSISTVSDCSDEGNTVSDAQPR